MADFDYSALFGYNPQQAPLATRPVVNNAAYTAPAVRPAGNAPVGVAPRTGTQQAMDFLGSRTGQNLTGAAIGGLGAYLQSREAGKNRDAAAAESEADRALREEEMQRSSLARAAESLISNRTRMAEGALRPLGEGAAFAQRQARGSAIADLLGQRAMSANPRIAAAQGPGQRVSPEVLARIRQASSPNATASALAQRDMDVANINPASAGTDLGELTGLNPESPFLAGLIGQRAQSQQAAQGGVDESESYARQLLRQAIDMPSLSQPGGAAGKAAPFRTPQRRAF
jgi:hypothetical protein